MRQALLLIFLMISFLSAAQDYEKQWEKVIEFEAEDLIKSASDQATLIYNLARKDRNEPQIIKAFLFRSKYMQKLEEDAQVKIVDNIKSEIATASVPAASILQSFYAKILTGLYEQNRYSINNRTNVDNAAGTNYLTWTKKDFEIEITAAYERSINAREVLYNTPLSNFDAIVDTNPLSGNINRSLYDFLAEQYLLYLQSGNENMGQYLSPSQLHQLFGTTEEFAKLDTDSIREAHRPSLVLQKELEEFYARKNDRTSLYRSVLRRLQDADTRWANPKKHLLLLSTLYTEEQKWDNHPFVFRLKLMQAKLYKENADKKLHPDYNRKALELCNEIISNSRITDAAPQAQTIKNTIVHRKAFLTTEDYTLPNRPILAKVNFKNIDSLKINIYKVPYNFEHTVLNVDPVAGKMAFITKTYVLPNKKDHFEYDTEIVLPALPKGAYIIKVGGDKPEEYTGFLFIRSTQIVLIEQDRETDVVYQIADRETGAPLKGIKIIVDGKRKSTDDNGKLLVSQFVKKKKKSKDDKKPDVRDVMVIYAGDTLSTKYVGIAKSKVKNDDDDEMEFPAKAMIFTDRAIYRQGQTVHFKGIVTRRVEQKYSTVPNIYVSVEIDDASGNELKSYRLKTNEFGSFSEHFTIPKNVMTGNFSISVDEDEDYETDDLYNKRKEEHPFWDFADFDYSKMDFRVEEYKRPTFDLAFEPVTEVVSVNEEAKVTMIAKSYSGAPVGGAAVKYRVVRNSSFANSLRYGNDYDNKIIAEGHATTDNEGKLVVSFTAEPNLAYEPKELPVFNYSVYAEVTDINGETHETETDVNVGYHSLQLSAAAPDDIDPKAKNTIVLHSANLNGQFYPSAGEVSIYKVAAPARVFKTRPWEAPELQLITESEFAKLFPYIPYHQINNDSVTYSRKVYSQKVDTGISKDIVLTDFTGWEPGEYQLVYTAKDSSGYEVSAKSKFNLKRDTDTRLADNKRFDVKVTEMNGDFVTLKLSTALPLVYVNVSAGTDKKVYDSFIKLDGGTAIVKVPLEGFEPGWVTINVDYFWQNEFFTEHKNVDTENNVKQLNISASTFINKLQPGKPETWSFIIDGNGLPTEILASMYDMSLDKFETKQWRFDLPDENGYYYGELERRFTNRPGPATTGFDNYPFAGHITFRSFENQFNTFGFDIINSRNIYRLYSRKIKSPGSTFSTISGMVVDEVDMPVPGVNIIIIGTDESTQTDNDGYYSIPAAKGDVLEFSFIGYSTQRIAAGSSDINVKLEADMALLENVIVDAYRSTTTVELSSGTFITIDNYTSMQLLRTLQGQVAGLNIATGSGQPGANSTIILRGVGSVNNDTAPLFIVDGVPVDENGFRSIAQSDISSVSVLKDAAATSLYGNRGANGVIVINTKNAAKEFEALQNVQARRNFDETAFFYPQLLTNKEGKISFTFTTPEALTEWKLRLLAHNKNGESGYFESVSVTQKDLMVVPNMPRFLREKDTIVITAKITNLTTDAKTGSALLQLSDAMTMQPADNQMLNLEKMKPFNMTGKGSTTVSWKIAVPEGMQGVHYKIVAKAGDFTDGEENILPVLSNNMLVTESTPLWVKPNTTKEFTLKNLKDNTSSTLRHHAITLEYTSNPAWLALQSLPYLMEFEHECAEQVFSRFYANAIASHILKSNPKIAEVFAGWKKDKPVSRLEQNEELKSVILAETPWLLDTQSEEDKKARLALLFEFDAMSNALTANFEKLYQKPGTNGGFPWFDGGKENEFITRHILAGFGHLNKLGIVPSNKNKQESLLKRGVKFIDDKFLEQHTARLEKKDNFRMLHYDDGLHYLYTRSFYLKDYPLHESLNSAVKLYLENIKANWKDYTLYQKGMAALTLNRFNDSDTAKKIIRSLSETASNNEEWGMYWIANKPGWYWSQAPVETQALLIEAFMEVNNDVSAADAMKVWLIKNKQNKNWPTTKATTEAVYAFLMQGSNWLAVEDKTTFKAGDETLLQKKLDESKAEAGSGYVKLNWKADEVSDAMATLTVTNGSAVPGYGGYYWQYFEDLDKIKAAQDGIMNVTKELYLKKNTASGQQLQRITTASPLKIGDLVTIRLVITTKEDMEYIHLKDLRAAAFEPVSVLSRYQWKDGLGFYQSTRDAATHFFFDRINKGTYVLEYDVRVNNSGEFSNGITTIQSMYAPEFSSHTKGIRIKSE